MSDIQSASTIVIIGSGCSGTLLATHLLNEPSITQSLRVVLIERTTRHARGLAYGTHNPVHLLNVPAAKMSAFPDAPEHFLRWMQHRDGSVEAGTFVPRLNYGEYLQAVLDEARRNAPAQVSFELRHDEAVAVEFEADGKRASVSLRDGEDIKADRVVLALGNFTPPDPFVPNDKFYESERYIRDPWNNNALDAINADDSVFLIGTGLTMLDVVLSLRSRKHRGAIHALSRHGLLPQTHKAVTPRAPFAVPEESPLTMRRLLALVRRELREAEEAGDDWRTVIDSLRPATQKLWQALSLDERKRFLRHVRHLWEVHRHRVAPAVAAVIDETKGTGQLSIHAGRIEAYEEDERGDIVVRFQSRGGRGAESLRVTHVINCTGPHTDFAKVRDPLIESLREGGWLSPDSLKLGVEVSETGALIKACGTASKILYTLGPLRKARLWETTAVPEIRIQAATLAHELRRSLDSL